MASSKKSFPLNHKPWTAEELKLLDLVVRIVELDPPLEKTERTLEKSLQLVRRLRADGTDEEVKRGAGGGAIWTTEQLLAMELSAMLLRRKPGKTPEVENILACLDKIIRRERSRAGNLEGPDGAFPQSSNGH